MKSPNFRIKTYGRDGKVIMVVQKALQTHIFRPFYREESVSLGWVNGLWENSSGQLFNIPEGGKISIEAI
jgi:hypothetical protein